MRTLSMTAALALLICTGCGGDPASNAPDLAGSWTFEGTGVSGCWVFDETGDPVSFVPQGELDAAPGLDTLELQGTAQSTELGGFTVTVATTGQANQTGDNVTIETITNASAIIQVGSLTISMDATIDEDTLAGQATTSGNTLLGPSPPSTSDFTATRDGC